MKFRLFLGSLVTVLVAGTAAAQTDRDTLALERAVVRYLKPAFAGKVVVLDSRVGLGQLNGHVPPERHAARTHDIAHVLGARVAHEEDVWGCTANCTHVDLVLALRQPAITGDSATVYVETSSHRGKSRTVNGEELLFTRTNGAWTFARRLGRSFS